jgi:hypothetical protein
MQYFCPTLSKNLRNFMYETLAKNASMRHPASNNTSRADGSNVQLKPWGLLMLGLFAHAKGPTLVLAKPVFDGRKT